MNTSYLKQSVGKDGKPLENKDGTPVMEEAFGLNPDTPKPASHGGKRRTRRPGEEADLEDDAVIAAELAAARAETSAAQSRASAAEAQLAAEKEKASTIEKLFKELGVTPEQIAEAQAKLAAAAAKSSSAPKK